MHTLFNSFFVQKPIYGIKEGEQPPHLAVQNRDGKKEKENCKKVLTKGEVCGRMKKLSERAGLRKRLRESEKSF